MVFCVTKSFTLQQQTGCPPVVSLLLQSAGLTIKWRKCSILLVVLGTASNGTNWICSYCFLFGEDVMPQFPGRAECLTSPGSIRFMKMNRLTMILNQLHCLTVHWGSQFQSWTRSFFKLSTVYSDCSLSAWSGLLSNYIYFFQHSKQKESAVNCIGIETVICLSEIVDYNMLWTKTEWKLSLQSLWSRSKTLRYINVSIILLLCTVILIVKISNYLSGGDIFFSSSSRKKRGLQEYSPVLSFSRFRFKRKVYQSKEEKDGPFEKTEWGTLPVSAPSVGLSWPTKISVSAVCPPCNPHLRCRTSLTHSLSLPQTLSALSTTTRRPVCRAT